MSAITNNRRSCKGKHLSCVSLNERLHDELPSYLSCTSDGTVSSICGCALSFLQLPLFLIFIHSFIYLFVYLFIIFALPGLSCSTQNLRCSMRDLQLWHADSYLQHAYGIQFPDQGLNLGSLRWERRVLPTRPPGKSQAPHF